MTTTLKLLTSLLLLGLAAMPAAAQSVWDGVYTAEQAERGKMLYLTKCAMCHGPTLEGTGSGPSLSGTRFRVNWNRRTADVLVELIRQTMPPGGAGSLKRAEMVDLIAFIFSGNGFPEGEAEMQPRIAALKKVVIKATED